MCIEFEYNTHMRHVIRHSCVRLQSLDVCTTTRRVFAPGRHMRHSNIPQCRCARGITLVTRVCDRGLYAVRVYCVYGFEYTHARTNYNIPQSVLPTYHAPSRTHALARTRLKCSGPAHEIERIHTSMEHTGQAHASRGLCVCCFFSSSPSLASPRCSITLNHHHRRTRTCVFKYVVEHVY